MPIKLVQYNSFGNPVQQSYLLPANRHYITDYYYETYDDALAVKDAYKHDKIIAYPNPTRSLLHIYCKESDNNLSRIELFNAIGQKVFSQMFDPVSARQSISLASLPSGVFILTIVNKKGAILYKQTIMKE